MKPGLKVWIFLFLLTSATFSCCPLSSYQSKDLLVHFIDVGYGDSILIEFPDGKNMVIDAGSKQNSQKVIDYLSNKGIKKIDIVMISHPDRDHLGGISAVAQGFDIDTIITNEDISKSEGFASIYEILKNKKIKFAVARRQDTIDRFKGVKIEILHPDKLRRSSNDSSIVIKLNYKNVSFLFTGDIGSEICQELIAIYGYRLKSDILKAPRHGKTKSEEFINIVWPSFAIVSVGPNNWQAPSTAALSDYKRLNIPVLRTDEVGSIVVGTDGKKFWFSTEKD